MRIFLIISILIALFSCKKKSIKDQNPAHVDLIAPCELEEMQYDIDSVFYGKSKLFPNAPFSVKLIDTTLTSERGVLEFAFNKVPTTGIYYLVKPTDLGVANFNNQISFIEDFGAYLIKAIGSIDSNSGLITNTIYVENNQKELIISFCEMSGPPPQLVSSNEYISNGPGYRKYKITY